MTSSKQLAKHLREVYVGGNWTAVNLKDALAGINWKQATTKLYSLNTIAALVFHINYYVSAALRVLQGGSLDSHDKFSFDLPPISSEEDWQKLIAKTFHEAEVAASRIDSLDEAKLFDVFEKEKYGNYFRNIAGLIEHTHYHLGQIVLLKKILNEAK